MHGIITAKTIHCNALVLDDTVKNTMFFPSASQSNPLQDDACLMSLFLAKIAVVKVDVFGGIYCFFIVLLLCPQKRKPGNRMGS